MRPYLALLLLVTACADPMDPDDPVAALLGDPHIAEDSTALVEDGGEVRAMSYVETSDGLAIAEGDIILGTVEEVEAERARLLTYGVGVESRNKRWPDRLIPYEIHADLPLPDRVATAIGHIEATTDFDFVERTTETDFVEIIETSDGSVRCASAVGRSGGRQTLKLSAGFSSASIAGVAIAKSNSHVYTWTSTGMVVEGVSSDLDRYSSARRYEPATGYSPEDIVGVAIAPGDRVFAFYDDGRFSVGTSWDLDRFQSPVSYALSGLRTPADIVDMDFEASGTLVTYFVSGNYAQGSATNLVGSWGSWSAQGSTSDVVGVGIAGSSGLHYQWNLPNLAGDTLVARGARGASASSQTTYAYTTRGGCSVGNTIHELGHVMGLYHEQSRSDRNTFVRIHTAEIEAGAEHNFDIVAGATGRDLGTYDLRSLMHYGAFAFARGANPTITTVNPANQGLIGQRAGLSTGDILSLRQLYGFSPAMRGSSAQYTPDDIVGIGIAGSTGHVYAWHDDGFRTRGRSWDHDNISGRARYTLPPRKSPDDIVAVAIAKSSDHVYYWYDDGTVSSGTTTDADRHRSPYSYSLPPGYTPSDILAIAIRGDDRVVTYFNDGDYAVGRTHDLDRFQSPRWFRAPWRLSDNIVGIDFTAGNHVYAWYDTYDRSVGVQADLEAIEETW